MGRFIVSARKYRPERFSDVVGQEAISTTLKNAIRNNHLGHAYLFCGPRGVGKTTCARIFAKTINCSQLAEDTEPCNECESCLSFNDSRAFNIHELDAASNNSVDDIRNLTDQVRIPPQIGNYSVYIIDEVHMLSAQAFNAFLKTLEEPPAHAMFILATTEKHKIIPTILSRCQIFDFKRIRVQDAVAYMKQIAAKEGIDAEEDGLTIIARKADGAMRDALSVFDQIVSFSGNRISYKDVITNLNILDYDYYFRLTDAILESDVSAVLMILEDVLSRGFDGHHFLSGFSSHLRDLLVARDPVTLELLETGSAIRDRYLEQSAGCPVDFLYQSLDLANQAELGYRSSQHQRLHIELFLIRLTQLVQSKKKSVTPEPGRQAQKSKQKQAQSVSPAKEQQQPRKEESKAKPESDENRNYAQQARTQSIRDALNGNGNNQKEQEARQARLVEKRTEFDEQQLTEGWLEFAEGIRQDKPRMYTFLKNHPPVLRDRQTVEISFNNSAQIADFETMIKQDLSEFLWKKLDNNVFRMVPVMPEQTEKKEKLYTQEDKYEYLSRKNPSLEKLKRDMNLDLE